LFFAVEEFLVTLRQLGRRDQVGVVGGRVVIGVDAVPAAVRIARLRDEAARLRRVELQQRLVGQPVHRGGDREIPAALPGSALDRDARQNDRIGQAHVVHFYAGGILEHLPQRQALLLVHGGIEGQRALGAGRGGEIGNDPGRTLGRSGRGRRIFRPRRPLPKTYP